MKFATLIKGLMFGVTFVVMAGQAKANNTQVEAKIVDDARFWVVDRSWIEDLRSNPELQAKACIDLNKSQSGQAAPDDGIGRGVAGGVLHIQAHDKRMVTRLITLEVQVSLYFQKVTGKGSFWNCEFEPVSVVGLNGKGLADLYSSGAESEVCTKGQRDCKTVPNVYLSTAHGTGISRTEGAEMGPAVNNANQITIENIDRLIGTETRGSEAQLLITPPGDVQVINLKSGEEEPMQIFRDVNTDILMQVKFGG